MKRTDLFGHLGKTVSLLNDEGKEWGQGQLLFGLHGNMRRGQEKFLVEVPINKFFDGVRGAVFIELKDTDVANIKNTAGGLQLSYQLACGS